MDPVQSSNPNGIGLFSIHLDEIGIQHLRKAAFWSKLFSVVCLSLLAILLVGGGFVMFLLNNPYGDIALGKTHSLGVTTGIMMVYGLMMAVYAYPMILLYRFSESMKLGIANRNADTITKAFRHLKNFFQYIAILLLIALLFYGIMIFQRYLS